MTSPKGGKDSLKPRKSTPTTFRGRGKGAAKAKTKRKISRKTIVKYLLDSLDDAEKASPKKASPIKASPKKPRLPLTKREKKALQDIESINKLGRRLSDVL